ncbi:MAG: DNA methyltransferase, partial [Candidatus Hodarchaeales archaeon]
DSEMMQMDLIHDNIIKQIAKEMDEKLLYRTACRECGKITGVRDYIYSETYSCPNCKNEIVFCEGSWEEISTRKRSKEVSCSFCGESFKRKDISNLFSRFKPIALRYTCNECHGRKKIFSELLPEDIKVIETRNIREIDDFYPSDPVYKGINTRQPLSRKIDTVDKFFTKDCLITLARIYSLINRIQTPLLQRKMTFVFTSIIFRTSKMYRLRVDGQGGVLSGTLYIPPVFQDINPLDVFIERYQKIRKGQAVLNNELSDSPVFTGIKSALNLDGLPDESIDYIYTDPPYAGNINYSELNLLWEAWLGKKTQISDEIIVNKYQKKSMTDYREMLEQAMGECYRTLKKNRVMTLVFHHTNPEAWGVLQKAIKNNGFITLGFSKIYSRMMTAKQTESSKAAQGFLLCHFLKPASEFQQTVKMRDFSKEVVQKLIRAYFDQEQTVISRERLYDYIIQELFDYCWIEPFVLETMINQAGIKSKIKKK